MDKSAPANRSTAGPFDIAEHPDTGNLIDFGAILLPANEQLQIRLDLEENSERIVALSIDHSDSVLQLQAFAAPKTEGIWGAVREQLKQSVVSQGGQVIEQLGSFGPELVTTLSITDDKGKSIGTRHAKFIGVDGPRWFLRGVIGGAAITDAATGVLIDAIFRKVVVNRGDSAVPPRDLLPLKLPAGVVLPPRN